MKAKRTGKTLSLILAVCMMFTMLTMTAYAETGARDPGTSEDELNLPSTQAATVAESVYAANNPILPIPGDVLQIAGGELKDGVLVFDLEDYDTFKATLANGGRFPITINRPKASEAEYSVSAKLESYSGSNANGRYVKFDDGTMICTMTLDIAYTHPTVFYSQNKSYPATFITEPVLTISSYLDSTSNWDATRIITSAFRFSTNNTTICIPISLLNTANEQHKSIHNMITAIGRWKA